MTTGTFSVSIYDVLLALKGIPYLPRVHTAKLRLMTAKDLMHTELRYLTLKGTYRDALRLVRRGGVCGGGCVWRRVCVVLTVCVTLFACWMMVDAFWVW